jgi:hypothetical protein
VRKLLCITAQSVIAEATGSANQIPTNRPSVNKARSFKC